MLKSKKFLSKEDLERWANSPEGTEYIISIITTENPNMNSRYIWTIFYIDETDI